MIINGGTLRQLRLLKGMKQETMAQKLSISQPGYCKLEKAERISGKKLANVLSILGYSLQELETVKKIIGEIAF